MPVSSAPIDNGTVVFSGGVITAVGANVTVPPGAITIAGKGLTVYPGLIDMGSSAGLEAPAMPRAENPQTTEDIERVKRDTLLRAHLRAADYMNPSAAALARAAEAGITAILATPAGDGIRGQSALVLTSIGADVPQIGALADDRRGPLVVRTPVALHVGIANSPGRRRCLSEFADGRHRVQPAGVPRRAVVPAGEVARAIRRRSKRCSRRWPGRMPVAFRASTSRDVLRALDMAKMFKLDPIITAARAGRRRHRRAQGRQRARHLQPQLPDPPRRRSRRTPTNRSSVLRDRANAPKGPVALDKAGILFAFESAGLTEPKDFLKNAQKTVASGLSKDAAIKALTINAATIAGAADRLGSLDKGKIANVIVTDGDLFDEKTTIKHVFVNGRPVTLPGR